MSTDTKDGAIVTELSGHTTTERITTEIIDTEWAEITFLEGNRGWQNGKRAVATDSLCRIRKIKITTVVSCLYHEGGNQKTQSHV